MPESEDLIQLSQTQSRGKHSLQLLQTMLAAVSQYTIEDFPKSGDFPFVSKYCADLGSFMALCVGHATDGKGKRGPALYIMDVSDGRESAPDLRCHTDTPVSRRTHSLDTYVDNNGIMANEFWSKLSGNTDSLWKISYTTDWFGAVFQYAQMMCGHRDQFVGRPQDLLRALEKIVRCRRLQAAKAKISGGSKSTKEGFDPLERKSSTIYAGPVPATSTATHMVDNGASAHYERSSYTTSTIPEKRTLEGEMEPLHPNKRARYDSLQVDTPQMCLCVYDVDVGYTCEHPRST